MEQIRPLRWRQKQQLEKRICADCHFLKHCCTNGSSGRFVPVLMREAAKNNDYSWKHDQGMGCHWGVWDENQPSFKGNLHEQTVLIDRSKSGSRFMKLDQTATITGAAENIRWNDNQREQMVTRWIAVWAIVLTFGLGLVDFILKILNLYPGNVVVNTIITTVVVTATPAP